MKVDLKCFECSEVMGTLEKPVVTQADIDLHEGMMTCSLGHQRPTQEQEQEQE